ncbi:MAG: hypothetical protein PHR44_01215 [Candidatus Omnitrophica bacterium]|nr:hypothetical protein [Candidatus Omnitrophota bacterium]
MKIGSDRKKYTACIIAFIFACEAVFSPSVSAAEDEADNIWEPAYAYNCQITWRRDSCTGKGYMPNRVTTYARDEETGSRYLDSYRRVDYSCDREPGLGSILVINGYSRYFRFPDGSRHTESWDQSGWREAHRYADGSNDIRSGDEPLDWIEVYAEDYRAQTFKDHVYFMAKIIAEQNLLACCNTPGFSELCRKAEDVFDRAGADSVKRALHLRGDLFETRAVYPWLCYNSDPARPNINYTKLFDSEERMYRTLAALELLSAAPVVGGAAETMAGLIEARQGNYNRLFTAPAAFIFGGLAVRGVFGAAARIAAIARNLGIMKAIVNNVFRPVKHFAGRYIVSPMIRNAAHLRWGVESLRQYCFRIENRGVDAFALDKINEMNEIVNGLEEGIARKVNDMMLPFFKFLDKNGHEVVDEVIGENSSASRIWERFGRDADNVFDEARGAFERFTDLLAANSDDTATAARMLNSAERSIIDEMEELFDAIDIDDYERFTEQVGELKGLLDRQMPILQALNSAATWSQANRYLSAGRAEAAMAEYMRNLRGFYIQLDNLYKDIASH